MPLRTDSGRRTRMSKRRSPWNSAPAHARRWPWRPSPVPGHAEAQPCQLGPVDLHRQHGQAGRLFHLHIGGSGTPCRTFEICSAVDPMTAMSSPNTFTATPLRDARDQLVETHLDRLRELVVVAGNLANGGFQ